MIKFLKVSFISLFAVISVFALSFSAIQACENNADCNKPCGSEKCEAKKSACCLAKEAKKLSTSESASDEVVLNVTGMTCGACANVIKGALSKCEGVKNAEVSHADGKAIVHVEGGKAKVKDLIKAVEGAGFSASEG